MGKPLSASHLQFCEAIVAGKSATAAYSLAYPDASKRTCQQGGLQIMRLPQVIDYFDSLKETRLQSAILTRDAWLERMANLADRAEKSGDISTAIKALREYGLAVDNYSPVRVDVSGESTLNVSLAATLAAIRS